MWLDAITIKDRLTPIDTIGELAVVLNPYLVDEQLKPLVRLLIMSIIDITGLKNSYLWLTGAKVNANHIFSLKVFVAYALVR